MQRPLSARDAALALSVNPLVQMIAGAIWVARKMRPGTALLLGPLDAWCTLEHNGLAHS